MTSTEGKLTLLLEASGSELLHVGLLLLQERLLYLLLPDSVGLQHDNPTSREGKP